MTTNNLVDSVNLPMRGYIRTSNSRIILACEKAAGLRLLGGYIILKGVPVRILDIKPDRSLMGGVLIHYTRINPATKRPAL